MKITRSKKARMEISLIPLINVVFLLLIFFLVAGTMENQDMADVTPPEAKSGEKPEASPFTLTLTADGMVSVNDIPITMKGLQNELSQLAQHKKYHNKPLVIKADASLEASHLVQVIGIAEKAGIYEVSLVTEAQ